MEGMSEREYSAHSGLSRGAIQKARKSGQLVATEPDGQPSVLPPRAFLAP